ncbi:VOC family protein [Actinokineospora iranica]|uniref:Uncharacterized protein n=1 Tax=Actinokineospora iranica TaxID=1271860 RepID=A0A1G6NFJ4_9PSEU|nr:hypothetical protein [Actinokineospora iranica]SDC66057.1 hypothetical protein SAMN05216174_103318 [Actinokineospora iranica]
MTPSDAISGLAGLPGGTPELATPDPLASGEFYRGPFGWTYREDGDGYRMAYVEDAPSTRRSGAPRCSRT